MNRRQSRVARSIGTAAVRLWRTRRVLLLSLPYFLLLGWLFSGKGEGDPRPAEYYALRDVPGWRAPDRDHWCGTAVNGADLFELSRVAMATSVSIAVVAVAAGIGLSLLAVSLTVHDERENRFAWIERAARAGGLVPAMAVLVVFAGGAGGGTGPVIAGLAFATAFHLAPRLCAWFREAEEGFDILALKALGLSRREIVRGRSLPLVLRRLPGLFAAMVPAAVLAEMSLSFLGLAGERLSVGTMVARGQAYLIEAPWMTVYPGLFATAVVLALSLLGWRVSAALGSGTPPRFL